MVSEPNCTSRSQDHPRERFLHAAADLFPTMRGSSFFSTDTWTSTCTVVPPWRMRRACRGSPWNERTDPAGDGVKPGVDRLQQEPVPDACPKRSEVTSSPSARR
jgi:hypothetical protein